jgi:TolA-binding protein
MLRYILIVSLAVTGCLAFGNDLAEQNRDRIIALQRMVMDQNERLDGLTSLMEGINASLAELKRAQMQERDPAEENTTRRLLQDLGKMIDEINRNYVSKNELNAALGSGHTPPPDVKKEREQPSVREKEEALASESASALYSEGVRHFVKKRYDEAQKRFLLTAEKGYKPAASNYYLGEIAYYTRRYDDAIFHYKKSAGLYDRAGYMDVLLLHTAIALDKTGKKKQAKLFYENVIETYPGKRAASIAKKRLQRM